MAASDALSTPLELVAAQQAALARLHQVVRQGALAVLCGPAGVGKSLVLERLACELQQRDVAGGSTVVGWHEAEDAMAHGVWAASRHEPRPSVMLLDDAHTAPDAAALSQLLAKVPRGTSVVLAGEGRLLTLLTREPALEQRVMLRAVLRPWTAAESSQLIADSLPSLLAMPTSTTLVQRLHELAGGVPRSLVRLIETVRMVLAADDGQGLTVDDLETFHRRLFLAVA